MNIGQYNAYIGFYGAIANDNSLQINLVLPGSGCVYGAFVCKIWLLSAEQP